VYICCTACTSQDKLDTIRLLVIGVSAHQKLELLERLVTQLGYDSLTVFGDCFDEVRDTTHMLVTLSPSLSLGVSGLVAFLLQTCSLRLVLTSGIIGDCCGALPVDNKERTA
jgi:hypothetical protein